MLDSGETKRSVGGSAGTVVSIAAGLYLQNNPLWGQLHPQLAKGFYAFAGFCLLYAALQRPWVQRLFGIAPPHENTSGNAGPIARSESSPSYKDSFKNELTVNLQTPSSNPPIAEKEPVQRPNMEIRGVTPAPLVWDRGMWHLDENGEEGIVATIFNSVASDGRPTGYAQSIVVTTEFADEKGHVLYVSSRAFWVGHFENEIYFPIGEYAGAVVGVWKDKQLFAFSNKTANKPQPSLSKTMVLPVREYKLVPVKDYVTANIMVVSLALGEHLCARKITILRQNVGFEIIGG